MKTVTTHNIGSITHSAPPPEVSILPLVIQYTQMGRLDQHKYVCGHCGTTVMGWVVATAKPGWRRQWLLCPQCGRGSVQNDSIVLPPPQRFSNVNGLPDCIASLYDEARASFGVQAYTGCEMLCRKILMNAAIDKGAKTNQTFVVYVEYLDTKGYVTSPLKAMATTIKDNGNDAVHEVNAPSQERAEYTLNFTRRILDTMYGVDSELGKYHSSYTGQTGAVK